MAVTFQLPKSEPDLAKIQAFNGMTVMVSKYLNPRQTATAVVPPTGMQYEQFLDLYTKLPMTHGPAYYKFTVTESGGTGEDVFMIKLGPEQAEDGSAMATGLPANGANGTSANAGPISEGVRQLGHGFVYDPDLGTLTTPWRTIAQWSPGQELPKPPAGAASVPAASPWGPNTMAVPGMGGWGAWPANDGPTERERALTVQIAEQNRQREMDKLRDDLRRQQDETTKQIAALIAKIGEKPSGPSESEMRLERELAETRRRTEEAERRAAEDRREEQRRQELREMREQTEKAIREIAGTNKQDAMLTMLTTLMTSTQQSTTEQIKSIQAMMTGMSAASERSTQELVRRLETGAIKPMELIQLISSAKGESAETVKMILATAKDAMGMTRDTYQALLDASGAPNQPAWLTAVEKVADRATAIGAAIAERQAQQPPPPPVQQVQMVRPMPMQQMQQPQQVMRPGATLAAVPGGGQHVIPPAPVANRPGAVDTGGRPEGARYDAANDTFLLRDGSRVRRADASMHGWRAIFAEPQTYVIPPGVVVPPPVMVGEALPAGAAQQTAPTPQPPIGMAFPGSPVLTSTAPPELQVLAGGAPAGEKPKRSRKKKTDVAVPLTLNQLREMDPAELFTLIQPIDDEQLFGSAIWPFVQQLRGTLAKQDPNMTPEKVAEAILQARNYVKDGKLASPMAFDLLEALQLDVLVQRLMPGAGPVALDAVAEALEEKLRAEGVEFPEAEDDEEGEETPAS